MLVKIGDIAVINMTALSAVYLEPRKEKFDGSRHDSNMWGHEYNLVIKYEDLNEQPAEHTIWLGNNAEMGVEWLKEVVSQVRDVEMEAATTHLENAMRRTDGEHRTSN